MKNANLTFSQFMDTVSPAAFSMLGSTKEKEIQKANRVIEAVDFGTSQAGYKAQMLSAQCTAKVFVDALNMLPKNKVCGNTYLLAWIS